MSTKRLASSSCALRNRQPSRPAANVVIQVHNRGHEPPTRDFEFRAGAGGIRIGKTDRGHSGEPESFVDSSLACVFVNSVIGDEDRQRLARIRLVRWLLWCDWTL